MTMRFLSTSNDNVPSVEDDAEDVENTRSNIRNDYKVRPGHRDAQARPGALGGAGRGAPISSGGAGRGARVSATQRPCQQPCPSEARISESFRRRRRDRLWATHTPAHARGVLRDLDGHPRGCPVCARGASRSFSKLLGSSRSFAGMCAMQLLEVSRSFSELLAASRSFGATATGSGTVHPSRTRIRLVPRTKKRLFLGPSSRIEHTPPQPRSNSKLYSSTPLG